MSRSALVVGAGGHCRVVLSLLQARAEHALLGIIDLGELRPGEVVMNVPVLGPAGLLDDFAGRRDVDVFLALGDNSLRRRWWTQLTERGCALPNLVSPHALVDPSAHLGQGNVVCARAFVGPDAVVGDNNLLNTASVVEHEVRVGSHCHVAPGAIIAGRSTVADGCFVGANATVIDKVRLAEGITIGAGAVVVRSVSEAGGVYVGTPAKQIGRRAE